MHFRKQGIITVALALFFAPVLPRLAAQDLTSVLARLDASAATFHSSSADFEYDITVTDPIPDSDVQKGTVYYVRKGNGFESGVHINEVNGKPAPKVIVFAGGVLKIYDKLQDQVTTYSKAGQYESYLALGFGASGKDLVQKFSVRYLGSETVSGVKTEKLELVAKDPDVRRYFPRITVWMDLARGVSLKQVFDQGQGQLRTCIYTNIKLTQPLPADAFNFVTDKTTQFSKQ
jgi:outer membrane lipoprotein-sorting protein